MHPSKSVGMCATISSPTPERLRLHSIVCYAMCGGCKQPKPPIVVRHRTTSNGRCATISTPTPDRLRLHIIVSYRIV